MFSGTDFQVNNSIFYNVNGDINLQTHHHRHLEIQHLHAPAPLRLNGGAGSQQHLAIEDRHAGLWPDVDSGGAQPASGPTRNIRHHTGTATRMQAPYDGSLRPRHAVISSNEGPSSFGAVMAPGGWPGSHSTPELVYPPPSDHFHSPPHPQYFYPHDTDNSQSGRESNYPHPDYEAAQNIPVSSNERGYSTPYLNSPNPPPFFQGGTYITAQNVHQGYTGMHILHRSVTLEALYDSADSFPQPRCHPETRTEMLAELYNWLTGNNTAQSIWWLYGPAGAGKSAIMQTLCRQLKDTGRLGGTFFFKRGHPTRGNAKALFTTLAYQLAENNDHLKPMISQTVEHYSSIVGREMEVQLHHLIVEPCRLLTNSLPSVLLIDGLDECQDESVQCEILRLIGNAVHQNPGGLRFLIASRPEAAISETVKDPVFDGLLTHLNVEQSFHDVRTYLQDEFARIHREHHHTMHTVPTPWPSPDNLDSLVKKSSGYFVYASTVIKFVDDKSFRPTERLNAVQNLQCDPNSDTPFTVLDQLYIHILSSVPLQFRSRLLDILQCVTMGFRFTLDRIDRLFEWHPGDSQLILRRLPSLLKIPSYKWRHIFALHASLLDFLQDEGRSAMFHLNLERRMIPIRAVFKAFSYENGQHKSISQNDFEDVYRCFDLIPPSAELIPLIQSLNPDFLWRQVSLGGSAYEPEIRKVVTWLAAIHPAPEDVIRRWENYHFMSLYELSHWQLMTVNRWQNLQQLFSLSAQMLRVLQTKMSRFLPFPLATYHQFMVQSPEFIRIFQARWLLTHHITSDLYEVRLLLGESWDNIIGAFAALRPITGDLEGENSLQVVAATIITLLTLYLELFPGGLHNIPGDLACGCLRLFELGWSEHHSRLRYIGWGQLVRCSPYSNSSLLCALAEFIPLWDNLDLYDRKLLLVNFHNVIQWLKAHPDQPRALIARWEGYLLECQNWFEQAGMEIIDDLEDNWRSFPPPGVVPSKSELRADFDEEEVICSYEEEVESMVTLYI